MATATRFPTGSATATGTWTNGATGLNADDGTNASFTTTTKNDSRNLLVGTFGFHSVIPVGSVINSVAIEVQQQVTSGGTLRAVIERAGVAGANNDNITDTALTVRTYSALARPGGGSWTRDDLSDANLKARVYGIQPNNTTSRTYTYDYVKVIVDYTPPVTGPVVNTLPALIQDNNGVQINKATLAETLPGLTQDANAAQTNPASMASALPGLTQSASTTVEEDPPAGPIVQTLPTLSQAATAERGPNSGSVTSSLPGLSQTATGTRDPNSGGIVAVLPTLTQEADGQRGPSSGGVSSLLPALEQQAEGERAPTIGSITSSLSGLTQEAEAQRDPTTADVESALPSLSQSVSGTHGDVLSGAIGSTLPSLLQTAAGEVEGITGAAASSLPTFSSDVVVTLTVSAEVGSLLPLLVQAAGDAEPPPVVDVEVGAASTSWVTTDPLNAWRTWSARRGEASVDAGPPSSGWTTEEPTT